MANLKLNITGQLNNLIPVSGNTFKFIIRYYNMSDVLLPNSQLTQNAQSFVSPMSNTFNLNFPIADGTYSIPNVKIKLYNNSVSQDCFAEFITTLNVNCNPDVPPVCNPEVSLNGTPTQTCLGASTVTINGTSLVSTGGTSPYQYALVKTSDFTNVGALSWGSTKTWTADENTAYRIYTRGANTDPDSSCYDFISLSTINCDATTCSPSVTISGSPSQVCLDSDTVTVNGTSLSGNGGNSTYQWAIIKTSDFTNIGALTWGSTKTWNVDHLTSYRIYVRDTSGINSSTCYSFITITTIDCSSDECISGPDLLSISSVTSTGLNFIFDGTDITSIKWRIYQGSSLLRNSTVNPTSSLVSITYASLSDGNYRLEIEGNNCTSDVSDGNFTIFTNPPTDEGIAGGYWAD